MIALLDYGAGNLASVRKAFAAVGAEVSTPASPSDLRDVSAIVVPGVAHFDALSPLEAGWRGEVLLAVQGGVPLLGICLGLQWLFEGSPESASVSGLGLFRGRCERLPEAYEDRPSATGNRQPEDAKDPLARLKVPHVGWNTLRLPHRSSLMAGVPDGSQVYFTHSYAAPVVPDTAAVTTYGIPFSAAVQRDHIAGVQFHPEKSGDVGLRVLRNWVESV